MLHMSFMAGSLSCFTNRNQTLSKAQMNSSTIRYLIFAIIEILLIILATNNDLERITPWLLGVNFTISAFSINFTFFGYQLSKYQSIYTEVTKRQWINIGALLTTPFIPLICYLISPSNFGTSALLIMPIMVLSALDNSLLTASYLDPIRFSTKKLSKQSTEKYINQLSQKVVEEIKLHKNLMEKRKDLQTPPHGHRFQPSTLGTDNNDLWDITSTIAIQSINNNDYTVFRKSIKHTLELLVRFYQYESSNHQEKEGLRFIAHQRFRALINQISESDQSGVFLLSLANELCDFLELDEILTPACSDIAISVTSDAVNIGEKILEEKNSIEPQKILNTLHRVTEAGLLEIEKGDSKDGYNAINGYNIASYVYDINRLGEIALKNGNHHFSYRCMETLSYLGCNAAKIKAHQTIVAVLESIVNLGRVARSLKIGCFYHRCLIPAESHAEEFMGHIMTWLVRDIDKSGNFYMKEYVEQSYSRLRGVQCTIIPRQNRNPRFWIEEIKDNGKPIPHIEHESGMYGYDGELDYSDFSNLKQYVLHGISPASGTMIFHSAPTPIKLEFEDTPDK